MMKLVVKLMRNWLRAGTPQHQQRDPCNGNSFQTFFDLSFQGCEEMTCALVHARACIHMLNGSEDLRRFFSLRSCTSLSESSFRKMPVFSIS